MDASTLIGWDCESWPTTAHDLTPPLVSVQRAGVGSYHGPSHNDTTTKVVDVAGGWASVHVGLDALIVGASILAPSRDGLIYVAHRSAYDVWLTATHLGMEREALVAHPHRGAPGHLRCTAVRETLIRVATGESQMDHRKVFSLGSLVSEYLGLNVEGKYGPDRWTLRYRELQGVPLNEWPTAALDYALMDGVFVRDVFIAQSKRAASMHFPSLNLGMLAQGGWIRNETEQTRAALDLHAAAAEGMYLDPTRGTSTVAAWEAATVDGLAAAREAGFLRADGTKDMAALRARVSAAYASVGQRPPMTRGGSKPDKKGEISPPQVSTSGDALLGAASDPLLAKYSNAVEYLLHLSKYRDQLQGPPGRVVYKVTPCLSTGRVSVAEPPFGQPPKEGGYRECWTVPDGDVLVSIDYNQVELVALAWICREHGFGSTMADAINAGIDLHYLMAVNLLNGAHETAPGGGRWTYERAIEVTTKHNAALARARKLAKVANFGLDGGMGAASFATHAGGYGLPISEAEAHGIIQVYLDTWSEMPEYFKWISSLTRNGDADMLQPWSGRVRGLCRYTQACNTLFQGLAADGMKHALAGVHDAVRDPAHPAYGARVMLTLHDEFLLRVPFERLNPVADVIAGIVRERMEKVLQGMTVKAEPAAMWRWSKDAETLRDEQGNLLVWGDR